MSWIDSCKGPSTKDVSGPSEKTTRLSARCAGCSQPGDEDARGTPEEKERCEYCSKKAVRYVWVVRYR